MLNISKAIMIVFVSTALLSSDSCQKVEEGSGAHNYGMEEQINQGWEDYANDQYGDLNLCSQDFVLGSYESSWIKNELIDVTANNIDYTEIHGDDGYWLSAEIKMLQKDGDLFYFLKSHQIDMDYIGYYSIYNCNGSFIVGDVYDEGYDESAEYEELESYLISDYMVTHDPDEAVICSPFMTHIEGTWIEQKAQQAIDEYIGIAGPFEEGGNFIAFVQQLEKHNQYFYAINASEIQDDYQYFSIYDCESNLIEDHIEYGDLVEQGYEELADFEIERAL